MQAKGFKALCLSLARLQKTPERSVLVFVSGGALSAAAMSVAGIDIGSSKACIAVARKRGIDVLMNKTSKRVRWGCACCQACVLTAKAGRKASTLRAHHATIKSIMGVCVLCVQETPSLVSFGAKNRQLGTDAEGGLSISPRNTIFQLKRLLGKKFSAPDVQEDIQRLPFEVKEGPDGGCQVVVDYLGERSAFSPEQLMAMLLVDMKAIAETDGSPVTDCVLSVPTFYTEAERYAMLNAAQIAGVNCLRLINETTATALAYGIYKTDLPEGEPINVVFVDVGADAFQVGRQTELCKSCMIWHRLHRHTVLPFGTANTCSSVIIEL